MEQYTVAALYSHHIPFQVELQTKYCALFSVSYFASPTVNNTFACSGAVKHFHGRPCAEEWADAVFSYQQGAAYNCLCFMIIVPTVRRNRLFPVAGVREERFASIQLLLVKSSLETRLPALKILPSDTAFALLHTHH